MELHQPQGFGLESMFSAIPIEPKEVVCQIHHGFISHYLFHSRPPLLA